MSNGGGARTFMDGNTASRLQSEKVGIGASVRQCLGKGRLLLIQRDGKGGEVVPGAGRSIVYATSRGVGPHMTVAF